MECPKCHHENDSSRRVCEKCGEKLPRDYTDALVFSDRDMPKQRNKTPQKVLIVSIVILVFAFGILGAMWLMKNRGASEAKKTEETTAAVTEVTTEPRTDTQPSTAKPAEDASKKKKTEEMLTDYAAKSEIYELLEGKADGDMGFSLTAEKNVLIAKYTVYADSSDASQEEYFNSLDSMFGDICASLDVEVDKMKKQSGVQNAEMEIIAVDSSNREVFSQIID